MGCNETLSLAIRAEQVKQARNWVVYQLIHYPGLEDRNGGAGVVQPDFACEPGRGSGLPAWLALLLLLRLLLQTRPTSSRRSTSVLKNKPQRRITASPSVEEK